MICNLCEMGLNEFKPCEKHSRESVRVAQKNDSFKSATVYRSELYGTSPCVEVRYDNGCTERVNRSALRGVRL